MAPVVRTQLVRWGNSHAIRIPKAILDQIQIKDGDELRISVKKGQISIEIEQPLTLDSLLAGVTPENRHGELRWGPSAGREAW